MFCKLICIAITDADEQKIAELKKMIESMGYRLATSAFDAWADVTVNEYTDDLNNNLLLSVHRIQSQDVSRDVIKNILDNEPKFGGF